MYCGKAIQQTLRERLRQHWANSHNENIKSNRDKLWFRFKCFKTPQEVEVVEGVHLAALKDKDYYCWNKRNEWSQHFALEDI